MKKLLLFFALLLVVPVANCGNDNDEKESASKVLSKTFATSSTPTLNVNNCYGRVTVLVWSRNAVEVTASLKGYGATAKIAEQVLGSIDVQITGLGNTVDVYTQIVKGMEQARNVGYEINLDIKVPLSTYLNLENKYGHVKVERTTKSLNATVKYGNLSVGEVAERSTINVKYGNLDVQRAGDITLDIKYGNMRIGQVETLNLTSSYGKHTVDKAGAVYGMVKYDGYTFGSVNSIDFSGSGYTTFSIGELRGFINLPDLRYGKLKVDRVLGSFKSINVQASYSDVKIGVDGATSFALKLSTSYGSLNLGNFQARLSGITTSGSMRQVMCNVGDQPGSRSITVSNRYGNIQLEKN